MRGLARDFLTCVLVELLALTGFALESYAIPRTDGIRVEICAHSAPDAPPATARHPCPDCLAPVLAAEPPRPDRPARALAFLLPPAPRDTRPVMSPPGRSGGIRGPPVTA
ncbi:MAG TPA: hypothetical protein PKA33_17615 [Amaricoccus sp.]|uniref:hypothetical protein n=1 Tax=Amaricoccus sp. TaxID=1872485 RepID=UPI002C18C462|nr:hypothetical protein [Amaricoccus sp.]HMQ93057.1 hypothetical protein [Amaricoccus sp.]HMR54149.1 hypothetical protein [Amaricoccus sp.]HMR60830.1 hypothetical protein [Amaricoccus sp.]HMU01166.1 hypothetical protein [Amaricoccus sp.]